MTGLLGRLIRKGARPPSDRSPTEWHSGDVRGSISMVVFDSTNRAVLNVVGESAYQGTLERIGGGRTIDGCALRDHTVVLVPEPSNRYDPHAVRVVCVPFSDSKASGLVGYLSREDALAYRPVIDRVASVGKLVACAASLTGGWDRGAEDRGHIGVRLHLDTPEGLHREIDSDPSCLEQAGHD